MLKKLGSVSVVVSLIASVLSCGGGDGGVPASAPTAAFGGTVTDAVITNGTLKIFEFDNGARGQLIASTTTDGSGDFVIEDFASANRPVMVEVSRGRYTEEASGVSVTLLDGQVLRAYLFYEQGTPITVQITPLTHLAACLADYKISAGTNVNNAITEATSVFAGLAGVDILGTRPLDITDPNNANFEVTDSLRYGTLLAAISSFTADVSVVNGVTPHRFNQNSSIYATQVLCQDIAADGVFNGLGFINNGNSVGQLSLGSVPLDVDTFRNTLAQNILSMISSDRNNTSLGVDDFVLYANEVASSTDAIYGGVPSAGVDQEGPISTAQLAPDSFIKGLVDLGFDVSDPIGLKAVQFEVNGVLNANAQVDNPVLSLNTTNYTDGVITITVVATDVLNNESRTDFNYAVDNTSPTLALTSPTLVNNKLYTVTGTYEAEGAPIAAIVVNGVNAAIDTTLGTWSADISLLSGDNTVTVQITDTVGNGNSVDVDVAVDLIFPTITADPRQVRFTTFQGQLNLCNTGQLTPSSGNTNPVCLSTDNVSLNGTTLSSDLQFSGYALLGFSPTDPQGAGVFTGQDSLIVEYMYELNNTEVIAWTAAPKAAGSNLFYYFPMVTEYLGANWFQTTTTDVHKVTFRTTDQAGNSTELFYEVRFDVLIPEVTINTVIDDAIFMASNFSNRTAIDGNAVTVSYDFDNPSGSTYLISLSDLERHDVSHTYETGIRENQARVRVTESWQSKNCGGDWKIACSGTTLKPVSKVTFNRHHILRDKTIRPAGARYSTYQNVKSDNPVVLDISGVPSITPLAGYSCKLSDINIRDADGDWATAAYANGSVGFGVCRFFDDDNSAVRNMFSELVSTISKTVQIQSGFPRNNITPVVTNYNINTEELSVVNSSLGQVILPINGWYKVPANTQITLLKKIRLPVLDHFYDSELGDLTTFSSYTQKKFDKTTTWDLDTELTISRVIDPGDINQVNNVTPSVSVAGSDLYQVTISR